MTVSLHRNHIGNGAILCRYRRASAEIFAVFRQLVPTAKIEKASVDEVYIDVTALVEKELAVSQQCLSRLCLCASESTGSAYLRRAL